MGLKARGIVLRSRSVFIQTDVCLTVWITCSKYKHVQRVFLHLILIFVWFFFLIDFPFLSPSPFSSAILGIWCSSLSGSAVFFGDCKALSLIYQGPRQLTVSTLAEQLHLTLCRDKSFLVKGAGTWTARHRDFFERTSLCSSKRRGQQDAKFAPRQCDPLMQLLCYFVLEDLEINWGREKNLIKP